MFWGTTDNRKKTKPRAPVPRPEPIFLPYLNLPVNYYETAQCIFPISFYSRNRRFRTEYIFINHKIDLEKREEYPIVVDSNNNVLWIPGIKKSIFDKEGQAVSLIHLGFSYLGLGNYIEAKNKCCEGLELAVLVNRKSTIGRCHQVLAEVEYIKKRKAQSRQHAINALSMFEKLGMLSEQEQVKKFIK